MLLLHIETLNGDKWSLYLLSFLFLITGLAGFASLSQMENQRVLLVKPVIQEETVKGKKGFLNVVKNKINLKEDE